MTSGPQISAIIPVYNGANFLAQAIESALAQSWPPSEVIVIDDGSTDGSARIASEFGGIVRCISQPNAGLSAARNAGLATSIGEFIAFLDHDDLWPVDSLRMRAEFLLANANIDAVFGDVVQFHESSGREDAHAGGALAGNMLARRSAFERTGDFDQQFRVAEFVDWYARARDAGIAFAAIPDVVLRRRLHDSNMGLGATVAGERVDYVRVLRAALERKRAAERGDA